MLYNYYSYIYILYNYYLVAVTTAFKSLITAINIYLVWFSYALLTQLGLCKFKPVYAYTHTLG